MRSRRLVGGVLEFARSGASPAERQESDLHETLCGVLEELRPEAAGVELEVEPFDETILVGCSSGILASVLSNLLRNAVEYMDDCHERRVGVRVSSTEETVRVEVEDTGPGLAPGLELDVFEPYVRAPDNSKPGLGLGLATVRRFVESHGGRVGVHSYPERGCVFWFELPRGGARTKTAQSATGR